MKRFVSRLKNADGTLHRVYERFRVPSLDTALRIHPAVDGREGFFRLHPDAVCFGSAPAVARKASEAPLIDIDSAVAEGGRRIDLPFDPDAVVDNLLLERYVRPGKGLASWVLLRGLYYWLRPVLFRGIRTHLQRVSLGGWKSIDFPRWPLDCSVERVLEHLLVLAMRSMGVDRLPMIWFWPEDWQACAIVTHDVEGQAGLEFCSKLMDMDEAHGVRAAFQLIPGRDYRVTPERLQSFRSRGMEVNVHDLSHDARLFRSREEFLARVDQVNSSGRAWQSSGFRSGALYRNQEWYGDLDFDYDMSVPNVAHMEAQRGGCCTVFPYFVGDVLELPLTTTQDYALHYLLRQPTNELWRQQMQVILGEHGLISILVHPDYLENRHAWKAYEELLESLEQMHREQKVWMATPGEVNRWWRERAAMTLEQEKSEWKVIGPGSERARVRFVELDGDKLVFADAQPCVC